MEIISGVISFILHIDTHLGQIINDYGTLSYLILFGIIFAETGFVFTPFLPGDSLLFAAGAFAALGSFKLFLILFVLWAAAFIGDNINYWIGHFFGEKILEYPKIPLFNRKNVEKTKEFYQKHGGKAVFLARFVPIIRTFAPFVAGVGRMEYKKYVVFSLSGGFAWTWGFTLLGYFFGNIPSVKEHFSIVVIAIILLSVMPIAYEFIKVKTNKSKE